MKISYKHFLLQFRHTFHIAAGARNTTDAVFVMLEENGVKGYGEIALPPYLETKAENVLSFLAHIDLPDTYDPSSFFSLLNKWNETSDVCLPALAALDIALHDLQGKLLKCTIRDLYKIKGSESPNCAYTIGMSDQNEMKQKLDEASDFRFFKLKLGGENDRNILKMFRENCALPFCVDANRGWKDVGLAVDFCNVLAAEGCVFAEQPFEKHDVHKTKALQSQTALPLIMDESVQTLSDIEKVKDCCSGINIKLVKCGGLYPAVNMIKKAREYQLKVFIGCMSEGSCGCGSAAQLSPLADWVDLDGPLLISNDPFAGLIYKNGRIQLNDSPGSGLIPIQTFIDSWE